MHTIATAAAAALLVGYAQVASAQSDSDAAAFFALILTPVGALPPLPPAVGQGATPVVRAFDVRYGNWSFERDLGSQHNVGIGGRFAAGGAQASITLGLMTCDGCERVLMAGGDLTFPLVRPAPARAGGVALRVGLQPALGVSTTTGEGEGTAIAASVSLPVALDAGQGDGPRIVPFLTPGIGFGRLSGGGESESGVRVMLGGGLGLMNRTGNLGAHVGFQKIFIEDGPTQFGLGLSFGR